MLLRWRDTTTSRTPYKELYRAMCHDRVGLPNVAREFCCITSKETTVHDAFSLMFRLGRRMM